MPRPAYQKCPCDRCHMTQTECNIDKLTRVPNCPFGRIRVHAAATGVVSRNTGFMVSTVVLSSLFLFYARSMNVEDVKPANKFPFSDVPLEVQAQFGLTLPLNRGLYEYALDDESSFSNPAMFFRIVAKNERRIEEMVKQFCRGEYTFLQAHEADLVRECLPHLQRHLVHFKMSAAIAFSPHVSFVATPTVEKKIDSDCQKVPAEPILRLIFSVAFKAGTLGRACVSVGPYRAFLHCFYQRVFDEVDRLAVEFHQNPKATLMNLMEHRFTIAGLDAPFKAWCLDVLADYNVDCEDKLSVIRLVCSEEKAMDLLCSLEGSEDALSRLVRAIMKAMRAVAPPLKDNDDDYKARKHAEWRIQKLSFALDQLLEKLALNEDLVRAAIDNNNAAIHAELAANVSNLIKFVSSPLWVNGSNLFWFVSDPEVIRKHCRLIPPAMYGRLSVPEKAAYLLANNLWAPKSQRDSESHGRALLAVLETIARGEVDSGIVDSADPQLVKEYASLLKQKYSLELCCLADRIDMQVGWPRISRLVEHPRVIGLAVDLTSDVPALFWSYIRRLEIRPRTMLLWGALSHTIALHPKRPLSSIVDTVVAQMEADGLEVSHEHPLSVGEFYSDPVNWQCALLAMYNQDLDALAISGCPDGLVQVTLNDAVSNQPLAAVAVPPQCRVVDLYSIMIATGMLPRSSVLLDTATLTVAPLDGLVTDHAQLSFSGLESSDRRLFDQVCRMQNLNGVHLS